MDTLRVFRMILTLEILAYLAAALMVAFPVTALHGEEPIVLKIGGQIGANCPHDFAFLDVPFIYEGPRGGAGMQERPCPTSSPKLAGADQACCGLTTSADHGRGCFDGLAVCAGEPTPLPASVLYRGIF